MSKISDKTNCQQTKLNAETLLSA